MAYPQFKLESDFVSPVPDHKTAVFTVNKGSTAVLRLRVLKDGAPIVPAGILYRIDSDTHQIKSLTNLDALGEETFLELSGQDNGIYKNKGTEQHVITLRIVPEGNKILHAEEVYNVTPMNFLGDLLTEAGFWDDSTLWDDDTIWNDGE